MAGSIEELLDFLYSTVDEAKNMPLSGDKCIVERDKLLDTLDDVRAQLPIELKRARDLLASRNEYIATAKREAEGIRKDAKNEADRLVSESNITLAAQKHGAEIVAQAEETVRRLHSVANSYFDNALRRLEDSLSDIYQDAKNTGSQLRSFIATQGNPVGGRSSGRYEMDMDIDDDLDDDL